MDVRLGPPRPALRVSRATSFPHRIWRLGSRGGKKYTTAKALIISRSGTSRTTQHSGRPRRTRPPTLQTLRPLYAAIKAVDPSAVVLTGGLAPEANSSTLRPCPQFLRGHVRGRRAGQLLRVDHPTPTLRAGHRASRVRLDRASQTSTSLRSLMVAHGDSAKKIWITEFGAPTGSGGVSETEQYSAEIIQAIAFVKQTSWVGSFYVYSWEDGSTDNFGLLDSSGMQKPAYAAVVASSAQ